MKKFSKKSVLTILLIGSGFCISNIVLAQAGPAPGRPVVPVEVRSFGYSAHNDLVSQTRGLIKTMVDVYENQVTLITDATFPNLNVLASIEKDIANNYLTSNDLSTADSAAQGTSNVSASNLIRYYLAGSYVRKKDILGGLANSIGDNGVFNTSAWENTQFKTVLPSQISSQTSQISIPSDSVQKADTLTSIVLNPKTFLNPAGYSGDQINDSKVLLSYIESSSEPPNVIKLFDSFDKMKKYYNGDDKITLSVPYSADFSKKNSDITLTEDQYNSITCDLGITSGGNCGNNAIIYQEYKNSYRAGIVARMMFLSTLLDSYSNRVPIGSKGDKSLAKIQNEEANYRLQPTYLNAIQKAPAATINLESLKLLAEIHHDLYMLQQQSERTNILVSLAGLEELSFSASPGSPAYAFGKYLYCNKPKGTPVPQECTAQSMANIPGLGR